MVGSGFSNYYIVFQLTSHVFSGLELSLEPTRPRYWISPLHVISGLDLWPLPRPCTSSQDWTSLSELDLSPLPSPCTTSQDWKPLYYRTLNFSLAPACPHGTEPLASPYLQYIPTSKDWTSGLSLALTRPFGTGPPASPHPYITTRDWTSDLS